MKHSTMKNSLVLAGATFAILLAGCELIVDFDRTKIPVEGADAVAPDSAAPVTDSGDPGVDAADDAADAADDAADAGTDAADAGDADLLDAAGG